MKRKGDGTHPALAVAGVLLGVALVGFVLPGMIGLEPHVWIPRAAPAKLVREANGGPPEALLDAFRDDDTCLVAATDKGLYQVQLDGFLVNIEYTIRESATSYACGGLTGGSVVWDADAIRIYSTQKQDGDFPLIARYGWDFTQEGDGQTGCLTLTTLYDRYPNPAARFDTLEFYTIPIEQKKQEPGDASNPFDTRSLLARIHTNAFGIGNKSLGQLPERYLQNRQEPDYGGDLSDLLQKYRGGSVILTFLANGVAPTFATRAACAEAVGIESYTGTAEQNAALLDALGAGSAPAA